MSVTLPPSLPLASQSRLTLSCCPSRPLRAYAYIRLAGYLLIFNDVGHQLLITSWLVLSAQPLELISVLAGGGGTVFTLGSRFRNPPDNNLSSNRQSPTLCDCPPLFTNPRSNPWPSRHPAHLATTLNTAYPLWMEANDPWRGSFPSATLCLGKQAFNPREGSGLNSCLY